MTSQTTKHPSIECLIQELLTGTQFCAARDVIAAGLIANMRDALEQAMDCLNNETPEDCSCEEARSDTIEKIGNLLNGR